MASWEFSIRAALGQYGRFGEFVAGMATRGLATGEQ